MSGVLRTIAIWICVPIYKAIPNLYSIFYFLSNARFLEKGVVDQLSKNLYVLVSVVMLFAFSATLLSAIVNPDVMESGKNKVWAVFKRAVLGIVLIVAVPFMFDLAYELQNGIMKNATIEKLILGINTSSSAKYGTENGPAQGGQLIAGKLISSVLYPVTDTVKVNDPNLGTYYKTMVLTDINEISRVAEHITIAPKDDTEHEYAFEFDGLVAIIAGAATDYILLIYSLDMAVRMFVLAFLEITAPIAILAYIALGNKYIVNWAKQVGTTFADVFIRIAAMGFYLFFIARINTFLNTPALWGISETDTVNSISGFGWRLLLQVIIIVGMLAFVKRIPNIINSAFGLKVGNGPKGLMGRLQPATEAFNALRTRTNQVMNVARRTEAAAAAVGANIVGRGLGAGQRSALRGESNGRTNWLRKPGNCPGILTSVGAARRGWQTGNLSAVGNEIAREKNMHPMGSTFGGRMQDILTESVGMGTAYSRANDRIARENALFIDRTVTDRNGNKTTRRVFVTEPQLKNIQSQDEALKTSTQSIIDAANKELDRSDSTFLSKGNNKFTFKQTAKDENGNVMYDANGKEIKEEHEFTFNSFAEANNMLASLRESGPDAENFYVKKVPKMRTDGNGRQVQVVDANGNPVFDTVRCRPNEEGAQLDASAYYKAQTEYQNTVNELEKQIKDARKKAVETLVNDATVGDDAHSWKQYNASGDSSNYTTASSKIQEVNNTLKNDEYAINVNSNNRTITDYSSLEAINTEAEKSSNKIDRQLAERGANVNVSQTTEEYNRAQQNAQANAASHKDNNMNSLDDNRF